VLSTFVEQRSNLKLLLFAPNSALENRQNFCLLTTNCKFFTISQASRLRIMNNLNKSTTTAASVSGRPAVAGVLRPQEPKLSVTYGGGQALPNSEAEMAAHGKAMAEFDKELARYNEAIEGQSRSRNRGQKRSHHGPSGNGNGNYKNHRCPKSQQVQSVECRT
jgi:hypothetical protein